MFALLSLVVCLAGSPVVCETVTPDHVRQDTGQPPTFFECLGPSGQEIARKWLDEHPHYRLRRIQCSVANDPKRRTLSHSLTSERKYSSTLTICTALELPSELFVRHR